MFVERKAVMTIVKGTVAWIQEKLATAAPSTQLTFAMNGCATPAMIPVITVIVPIKLCEPKYDVANCSSGCQNGHIHHRLRRDSQ